VLAGLKLQAEAPLLIATNPLEPEEHEPTLLDSREGIFTAEEGDLVRGTADPVGEGRALDGVEESDHAGDSGPGVLAFPAVRGTSASAGSITSIRGAGIGAREVI
jgi:hypothetical protein